jgi:glycosyltransferase involved in cell wall biosynthesis
MNSVSVCMTVFGVSEFLQQQLESVISQSKPVEELVVVEDYSGLDSPRKYITYMCEKFGIHLNYVSLETNVGPAEAFRIAIAASSGDVIYLCDHDDIWEPNRVENTIDYHTESSLVIANGAVFNSECMDDQSSIYPELNLSFLGNFLKNEVVGATLSVDGNFARELSNSTFFYPMHDWVIISFSLLTHRPIVFVDECLISYRRHSGTFTGVVDTSMFTKLKYRSFLLISLLFAYVRLGRNKSLKVA